MNFKKFIEGIDTSRVGDLSQNFSNSDIGFEKSGIVSKYSTRNYSSEKSTFNPEKIYGKLQKLHRRKRKKQNNRNRK